MNTQYKHFRVWAMLSIVFLMLPIDLLAQTVTHEMVLEKKDGTEITFDIVNNYPMVNYYSAYSQTPSWVEIVDCNHTLTTMKGYEIKRLFVREKTNLGISNVIIFRSNQVYDISGRKIITQCDNLSKGIYIINGRKVVVR